MKKIAVIEGGHGSEAVISKKTSVSFQKALDELKFSYKVFQADEKLPENILSYKPDAALLAVHGQLCEDGVLQGVLEYLKIPYTGSGVLASSLSFNKYHCKSYLRGLPMPKDYLFIQGSEINLKNVSFTYPWFVKAAREGSSVGCSKVTSDSEAVAAINNAFKFDSQVIAEQFIDGVEVTVTVAWGEVFPAIEIEPLKGFYDFESKYTAGKTKYHMPPRISPEALLEAEAYSLQVYEKLNLRSVARVDFMVTKENKIYFLEVNTLPGNTENSLVPMAAKKMGITYPEFIKKIIDKAELDYADKRRTT